MFSAERTVIVDPPAPQVISAPDDIVVTCRAETAPSEAHNLRMQWRRNGDVLNPPPRSRYVISDDGSQLTIRQSRVNDTATYTCRAENGVDFDSVEIPVTVRGLTILPHVSNLACICRALNTRRLYLLLKFLFPTEVSTKI